MEEVIKSTGKASEVVWRTTVTELVRTFRDSLAALAPVLEAAGFRTEEPDTTDDWDDVANALLENIVERSIRWSLEVGREVRLRPYATLRRNYDEGARIEVIPATGGEGLLIFHCLVSSSERFDSVSALTPTTHQTVILPLANARFVLRLPGADSPIESLSVEL